MLSNERTLGVRWEKSAEFDFLSKCTYTCHRFAAQPVDQMGEKIRPVVGLDEGGDTHSSIISNQQRYRNAYTYDALGLLDWCRKRKSVAAA